MADLQLRLNAVILSVDEDRPVVATIEEPGGAALPSGLLQIEQDRTLELGVRRWVREQIGLELGYVEQLYTFGPRPTGPDARLLSVVYLALVRATGGGLNCYQLFPWEDWRQGRPSLITRSIVPVLRRWAGKEPRRRERADITFGLGGSAWDPARVLERYELLYEVGLVTERQRDSGAVGADGLGEAMVLDHRRMVATALGRVRGKLGYRPVVFELLSPVFTLARLEQVVETLAGIPLHTPNFRRLVEDGLVERTGESEPRPRGRPAALYRFRREVLRERPTPGVGLPGAR